MKDIKVIVATHKKYQMPNDDMYIPVFVGAEGKEAIEGYQCDNEGENISSKNPYFCELTGLYWAWKNLDSEYVGLAHYRRHFTFCKKDDKFDSVLNKNEADRLLKNCDILLPKKRNYVIENLYDHYAHTLYVEPLDLAGEIIKEKYSEFYPEFRKLKQRKSSHMFNMMIMKKEILNEYCEWVFKILFEVAERVDPSQYEAFHARYPGRISELLLDVFINTKGYKYVETAVMDMEPINWFKKGSSFLKAKFLGNKYGKSF